jgi:hypothetical protein
MGFGPKHRKKVWYTAALGGIAGITGLTTMGVMTGMTPVSSHGQDKDRQATAERTLARPAMDGGANDAVEIGCEPDELIQAILDANDGGGTIKLAADCTYSLTAYKASDNGFVGLPEIEDDVKIKGQNSTIEREVSADPFRILEVEEGGHLTLKGVAVKYGDAQSGMSSKSGAGGGLLVEEGGKAFLEHSTFSYNRADYDGGAIANYGLTKFFGSDLAGKDGVTEDSLTEPSDGKDGATEDSLTEPSDGKDGATDESLTEPSGGKDGATHSSGDVHDNHADDDGGGIYVGDGAATIENARLSYNTANDQGGAVYNYSFVKLTKTEVDHNFAHNGGGGLANDYIAKVEDSYIHDNTSGNGTGGGIWNNYQLYLWHTQVSRNTAYGSGGGIYNANGPSTWLTAKDSRIDENTTTSGNGGGIYNDRGEVSLGDSEVNLNKAVGGASRAGGIYNDEGFVRLSDTKVNENSATNAPGGVYTTNAVERVELVGDSEIIKNRPTNCEGSAGEIEGCFG